MSARRLARRKQVSRPYVAAALGLIGLALAAYAIDVAEPLELETVDARFSVRGSEPAPADVVVVQLDERTLDELEVEYPFPRSVHADVIEHLHLDGARSISYDFHFGGTTSPEEDNALLDALDFAGDVVLAAAELNDRGESRILGGDDVIRDVHARPAFVGVRPDPGGVIRRYPVGVDGLDAFAVQAVAVATGGRPTVGPADGSEEWIEYRGPPGTFRTVSLSRVAKGITPRGTFRDAIVVVGPSAALESHPTPVGEMSGAEIHANAIATTLDGFPLEEAPALIDAGLIVLLGLAAPVAATRLRAPGLLILAAAIAAIFVVGAQAAFEGGEIVAVVYPLGALTLTTGAALASGAAARATARIRAAFARFAPAEVVDDALARGEGDLRDGATRLDATVMFCDLRGFTRFSEALAPERVVQTLNVYLEQMSEAITAHGGTVVDFSGDGIMAVFGAPTAQVDHADRAVAAAREMLHARLPEFNRWLREHGMAGAFRIGIGLNSGPVMSGNVGSQGRVGYTAIGDTTNVASRLESLTKETPYQLLVADSTRQRLAVDPPDLVAVDRVAVRGREKQVEVWSLVGDDQGWGARAK